MPPEYSQESARVHAWLASVGADGVDRELVERLEGRARQSGCVWHLGRYAVVGEVARGGMATVYDGWDVAIQRRVAIKALHLDEIPDELREESVARFRQEVRTLGRLRHRSIVEVYDFALDHEHLFAVMEYLEGTSLAERLEEGPLSQLDAIGLAIELAEALHVAHEAGVIHRDVKPGNVLLTRDRVVLLDFGIAKAGPVPLTQNHQLLGTPRYLSPERLLEKEVELDGRSDLFSLGAVLYVCLTGRPPFEGGNAYEIIDRVVRDAHPAYEDSGPLSAALNEILSKLLAKDREARFCDGREVAAALERVRTHWLEAVGTAASAGHATLAVPGEPTPFEMRQPGSAPDEDEPPAVHTVVDPRTDAPTDDLISAEVSTWVEDTREPALPTTRIEEATLDEFTPVEGPDGAPMAQPTIHQVPVSARPTWTQGPAAPSSPSGPVALEPEGLDEAPQAAPTPLAGLSPPEPTPRAPTSGGHRAVKVRVRSGPDRRLAQAAAALLLILAGAATGVWWGRRARPVASASTIPLAQAPRVQVRPQPSLPNATPPAPAPKAEPDRRGRRSERSRRTPAEVHSNEAEPVPKLEAVAEPPAAPGAVGVDARCRQVLVEHLDDPEGAVTALMRLAREAPELVCAHKALARRLERRAPRRAMLHYRKLLELAPDDPGAETYRRRLNKLESDERLGADPPF